MRVAITWPSNEIANSFFVVGRSIAKALAGTVILMDAPEHADLHVHVGTPEPTQRWMYATAPDKLVFYSFAESTVIPPSWTEAFNRCRAVWVPSAFCAGVFARCGVTVPVHVVPLGIAPKRPPAPRDGSAPFTVLWQGAVAKAKRDGVLCDGDRKRGLLVERAFRRASLPGARLILKSVPLGRPRYDVTVGGVREICEALAERDMTALDDAADLFVWPTRGEAFGLLPLEKFARGVPALVTDWSGIRSYLGDFPGHEIREYSLAPVVYNDVLCDMADVDEASLVRLLRERSERRSELRRQRHELSERAVALWDERRTTFPAARQALEEVLTHA